MSRLLLSYIPTLMWIVWAPSIAVHFFTEVSLPPALLGLAFSLATLHLVIGVVTAAHWAGRARRARPRPSGVGRLTCLRVLGNLNFLDWGLYWALIDVQERGELDRFFELLREVGGDQEDEDYHRALTLCPREGQP